MCKLPSGNSLGILLGTHLLVYSLTNTAKKFLMEPEFLQERLMLWEC